MAVQFILGPSGSGKTTFIYEKMIQDSGNKNHNPIIFMLPEQSNMAAEQDMVSMHPSGGTMDISILSFTRLAFKVFDEKNIHTMDILDDYGKSMLIMKLLKEHEEELTYYGAMAGRQGFVDEVKSILSEFYQYQITDKVLSDVLNNISMDKSIYYKLSDLRILLKAFEEAMQGSYMVAEHLLSLLKEVVSESELLKNADIYFDGFTGFTPIQYSVIEELMKLNGNLYFSFTMDEDLFGNNDYSEQGLFALSKQSVDKLCKLAQDNQITVLPHIGFSKNFRQEHCEDLQYLERQLFRFPVKPYGKRTEAISLLSAMDAKQEALYIAKQIKQYVMKEGYHYSDFAIVTGDLKEQTEVWKQAMDSLKVPYFLDFSESMPHNPIALIVGMIMELFISDFSYDSVFSFLKTGFLEFDKAEIYNLENYALKYGVRGYNWWSKAFPTKTKGTKEANHIRKLFIEYLDEIAPVFLKKEAEAREYIFALYSFMSANRMAERLQEKSMFLEEEGCLREAKAYALVYDKFLSVLDKTMDILGSEQIDREHFAEILLSGISDMQLGIVPSTLDQVMIGDMERSRLHHIRILFVAGANEGVLPKISTGKGILSDKDREVLKDMNISLAPNSKEELFLQQFYLYLQVTKPSERLIVTYRSAEDKGGTLHPSYVIKRLCSVFPKITIEKVGEQMEKILPTTIQEAVSSFANILALEDMKDASVYELLMQEAPEVVSRILEGYFYNNQTGILDRATAKALYGENMVHSVSRLETYAGCAYRFFLQYGLQLRKRDEYKVEANNMGTILHAVMEEFFKQVKSGSIVPVTMKEEELNNMVEAITVKAAKEENETIFESSFRSKHQLEVLIRIAKRSVANLCRHLEEGEMKPEYFEKKFSPEDELSYITMALKDDISMELTGFVDRVDIRETENTVYLKVIDYKSGAKDIDYVKMYEGKQLQLTVYMSVMIELLQRRYPDKKIIPTGMYYYHLYDPIIEETEEEKREKERIIVSRLSGLVNDDKESLRIMDDRTGDVVPVSYKQDGSLGARNAALVTTEDLNNISQFVRNKMIAIGEDIIEGHIEMNPEKGEINSPCNYCDYRNVCRFEAGLGGNSYRIGLKLDKNEAKNIILKKEKGETV